jgi:putative endonuclease
MALCTWGLQTISFGALISTSSKRYDVNKLAYFEILDDALSAITGEKQLKKWKREWKVQLIEKTNPGWVDLSHTLI